jgi:hypothetical protein
VFVSDPRVRTRVRWHEPGRPAVTPRPVGDETLSSYCMRLAGVDGLSPLAYVRKMRVSPYRTDFEGLERVGNHELVRHLADFTGRSAQSFYRLQFPHPNIQRIQWRHDKFYYEASAPLRVEARTAFCPLCWLERKTEHAGYLSKSWAYAWVFTCPRHPNAGLLSDIHLGHPPQWRKECVDRRSWVALAELSRPPWWLDLAQPMCFRESMWPTFLQFVRSYELNGRYRAATARFEGTYAVARDIAMYCQYVLDTPAPLCALGAERFGKHSFSLRDEDEINGTLIYRVNALALAFTVMRWFVSGMQERLPQPLHGTVFEGCLAEQGTETFLRRARDWPSIWKTKLGVCLPESHRWMLTGWGLEAIPC